jgi:tetratricopeptide (TPR) repeat protein
MDTKDIAEFLASGKTAVFCGAGLSHQAGIPLVNEMETGILTHLGVTPARIESYVAEHVPFEATMETLLSNSRCNSILSLFESNTHQRNHRMLARLAKLGILSHIITTNFDMCIEQALDELGVDYRKVVDQDDLQQIRNDSCPVLLVKLHGCISSKTKLGATIRAVANQRGVEWREAAIESILNRDRLNSLLVLGYSFSDRFDINPIFARRRFPVKVIVIQHATSAIPRTLPFTALGTDHPLLSYTGATITYDTDILIEELWKRLLGEVAPPLMTTLPQLQPKLGAWIAEIEKEHGNAIRPLLAALLFKTANMYSISNEYANKTLAIMDPIKQPFETNTTLQTIGDNYRDLQDIISARKYLRRAFRVAFNNGLQQRKAHAINSLGIILEDKAKEMDIEFEASTPHHPRKWAIKYYQLGIKFAQEAGDEEQLSKCEGNIGIALKNVNSRVHRKQALAHLRKALQIAQNLGDKKSEGRYYGSIASTLSLFGKKRFAIRFFEHARKIAEDLGDRRHIAIWTANIGEDYVSIAPLQAIPYLEAAIKLFTSLDNYGHVSYCRDWLDKAQKMMETKDAQQITRADGE